MLKQAGDAQRWETVERVQVRFAAIMLLAMWSASMCMAAEHSEGLYGTVRDEHGVPQMGAVVELIGTARGGVRTAVTGLDGTYLFHDLLAGTYHLRASASLFRPVTTRGVHVESGVQAVVNLTLASIYSTGTLLPVERRQPNEASDDWMWTMRSAASRPLLRLAGGVPAGQIEGGSAARGPTYLGVGAGAGGFGSAGASQMVATGFRSADGTREATGVARFGSAGMPVSVRMSEERRSSAWSSLSTAVSFEADPTIRSVNGASGWRSMRLTSAETTTFGDTAAVEVGGLLASDPSQRGMPASRPFGRVRIVLPGTWTVQYAMATDRSSQQARDASGATDALRDGAFGEGGISRIERGRHQAVALTRQGKTHTMAVSYYKDALRRTPVLGVGSGAGLPDALQNLALATGALVDGANGTFRAEGAGYTTQGCHIQVSQQVVPGTGVELQLANGAALGLLDSLPLPPGGPARLRVVHGVTAGVAVHSRVRRTGTMVQAAYQWQPERLVTPIDAFDAVGTPAYLGFTVQQRIPGRFVPRAAVVRISASNVLRQGLRNVVTGNQSVATLAQELPTLRAGVGFTF